MEHAKHESKQSLSLSLPLPCHAMSQGSPNYSHMLSFHLLGCLRPFRDDTQSKPSELQPPSEFVIHRFSARGCAPVKKDTSPPSRVLECSELLRRQASPMTMSGDRHPIPRSSRRPGRPARPYQRPPAPQAVENTPALTIPPGFTYARRARKKSRIKFS